VHVGVEGLALCWVPSTLVDLAELAVLLCLADYVLDALLDGLRAHVGVK